jgi:hypothetical protein
VAFDLKRAVRDTLAGGNPLLDRLMSYLHFADATVLTRTSWDEWGSGLTLLGLRGKVDSGEVIVLSGALPSESSVSNGGGILDPEYAARAVTLLAQCWALSSIPDPGDRAVALIGYRPDPLGASLSDALWSLGLEPAAMLVTVEGVGGSRVATNGLAVVSVSLPAVRRDAHGPCADIASIVWTRPDGRLGPGAEAFRDLTDWLASWNGRCLGVSKATGLDLTGPSSVDACIGGCAIPRVGPKDWRVDTAPGLVPFGGVPVDAAGVIGRLMQDIDDFATAAWAGPGQAPYVLGMRSGPELELLIAAPMPGMDRNRGIAAEDALRAALDRIETRECGCRAAVRAFHWGDGSANRPFDGNDGAAATLSDRIPGIVVAGPERYAVLANPGDAAEQFARECLDFLGRGMDS